MSQQKLHVHVRNCLVFLQQVILEKKLIKFSLSITQQLEQQTQTKFARDIKLSNFSATCLTVKPAMCGTYNHLHPNNSMYIPHTVLYTFLKELTERICLTI